MQSLSLLLYNLSIRLYGFGIFMASFFNAKAKSWLKGRKYQDYNGLLKSTSTGKRIWVHCASLGEFEQARPVIEKIKTTNPSSFIILTFFSPSGYEIRKDYKHADTVLYLPLDTAKNAIYFIDRVKPDLALFVKYEFWHYYLTELKNRKIPAVLFSAIFRKDQIFFKWYGGFFKNMLRCFDKIFVQNKESQHLLKDISIGSEVSFDTRFDRVYQIAQSPKLFPAIEKFKGNGTLLVAGSTWQKDEQMITRLINVAVFKDVKFIIAPHNLNETEIARLQACLEVKSLRLSQLTLQNALETIVIIVDTMGDLTSLYSYGDIAYVGGGFNASVHNVLEPAVYGMPVIFGPNYLKSAEAKSLIALTSAYSISNYNELKTAMDRLNSSEALLKSTSTTSKNYVESHLGGVNDIYKYLARYL